MQAIKCSIGFWIVDPWLDVQVAVNADVEDVLEDMGMLAARLLREVLSGLPHHAKGRGRWYCWLPECWL